MNPLETERLAELIDQKHDCLVQLDTMGRRQSELIDSGEIALLLELLAAKQRVLGRLKQLERALDPFRGQDPETRRWRTPEDRRRCAETLQRCEALLTAIIRREKSGERALALRRDQAAAQLQGAHLAGHARGAYTAADSSTINQLDLHSET